MRAWIGVAIIALLASGGVAAAEECTKPLKLITSIKLTPGQDHHRLFVPVEIGGKPKLMLLDTGAYTSIIKTGLAKELGLTIHDSRVEAYDLTGKRIDRQVATSFKIGRLQFASAEFMVSDAFDDFWSNPDVVGLLGANFLTRYDLSIDMVNDKLDLIDPDHCPDKVIYWPAAAYGRVALDKSPNTDIIVNVMLDGKPQLATLDTGAWNSTIYIATAEKDYGIVPGSPDTPVSGTLNGGENLTTYTHKFKTLDFEGVAVGNPTIELIPDKSTELLTDTPTGTRIGRVDRNAKPRMLLGMDILRHLHIYIAYHERALYVTPSSPTPAPTAPAKP